MLLLMALQKASAINFVFWWTVHTHTQNEYQMKRLECTTSVGVHKTLTAQSCAGKTSPRMTGITPSSFRVTDAFVGEHSL